MRGREDAMTTRRWFEFVSTRYHSSGSISTHVPLSLSLFVALVISIRPLLSPSLYTAAGFFLVPPFLRSHLLYNASSSRDRAASVHVLRPSGSVSPRSHSLSLSLSLSPAVSIRLRPAYLLSRAPVLSSPSRSPSSAMAPLAGPLSVESLCARDRPGTQGGEEQEEKGEGGEVHVPSRSTERNWYISEG